MANYAETLAYWYLRLNGFFPIDNFVLHDDISGGGSAPDCDLLAIRLCHTKETIGDGDLDKVNLFNPIFSGRLDPAAVDPQESYNIGIIAQVKGGGTSGARNAFVEGRVSNGLKRLGFFSSSEIVPTLPNSISYDLSRGCNALANGTVIAKILFAENPEQSNQFISITLSAARTFVRNRLHHPDFRDAKRRDWMRFPSDLIQYLIWEPVTP